MEGCPNCGAPAAPNAAARAIWILSKSVIYNCATTNQDIVVATVPACAAVDVYIRWRAPDGTLEDPYSGVEQWKVFALLHQGRFQVGPTRTTSQASTGNEEGVVGRRIFAVRDVAADGFDVVLNGASVAAGSQLFFDLVVVGWAKEPTGIGPFELSTFATGDSNPTEDGSYYGWLPFALDVGNGAVFRALTLNNVAVQPNPASLNSADGQTNLNVLPVGQYRSSAPTLTNLQMLPFQIDANGNLKVIVSSGAEGPFPAASALADNDPNPTTTRVGANNLFYDGATWDLGRSGFITAQTPTGWQNVLGGGAYNSSAPTLTSGQGITLQLDASGNLKTREQFAPVYEDNVNGVAGVATKPVAAAAYAWLSIFTTALAKSLVVKATPGIIRSITARVDSTATTGTYYLQLWNLTAAPADTTAVSSGNSLMAPFKVQHVNGTDDYVTLDFADGVFGGTGLTLELSTTEFTATLVGTAWLSATAEFV